MQFIKIYDVDADRIQKLCEKYDATEAEIIERMLENIDPDEEDFVF